MVDRLPDAMMSAKELAVTDQALRSTRWYRYNQGLELVAKKVAWFRIFGPKGDTGKVVLIATEDIEDSLNSLNRGWEMDSQLTFIRGGESKEMYLADEVVEAMYLVLDASGQQYTTKYPTLPLADRVYNTGLIPELIKGMNCQE